MYRSFASLVAFGVCVFGARGVQAQTAVLLAADHPTQIAGVQLAKVMASDSTLWLGVLLKGSSELAVVVSQASVEEAPAADAWLRALDFATRQRVAPPPGSMASCGGRTDLPLADSGLPEAASIIATRVASADSELSLRRTLADAGFVVDVERIAHFTRDALPPYQVWLYRAGASGGSTAAVRVLEHDNSAILPSITVAGLDSVPIDWIGLAREAVLPDDQDSVSASELPITYRAEDATSDYLAARASWRSQNPTRWLGEASDTSALFAWTVFPSYGQIAPVVTRYFQDLSGARAAICEAQVQAAYAQASRNSADFVCDGADDLAQSLTELGFGDLRLSRLFGSIGADGAAFHVAPAEPRNPLLVATDLVGCDSTVVIPPSAGATPPSSAPTTPSSDPTQVVYYPPSDPAPDPGTGSGEVSVYIPASSDSCSGDSNTGDASSSDSCSGNSSSQDSSSDDSCSGNSKTDDGGPDSCSGDSSKSDSKSDDSCSGNSDSSDDSSGCGKSGYDGDTCSGKSENSAAQSSSAALQSGNSAANHRPRRVHLSLFTLLAAALALPLRRLRGSR